jgi:hypothetical protein
MYFFLIINFPNFITKYYYKAYFFINYNTNLLKNQKKVLYLLTFETIKSNTIIRLR